MTLMVKDNPNTNKAINFELVNSIPELKFSASKGKLLKAIQFLISNDDWWVFENLLN